MDDREFSSPVCYLNYDWASPSDLGSRICSRCKEVLAAYGSAEINDGKCHEIIYQTHDLLETTANQGCPLCQLFYEKLSAADKRHLRENESGRNGVDNPFTGYYIRSVGNGNEFLRLEHTQSFQNPDVHKRLYISAIRLRAVPAESISLHPLFYGRATDTNTSLAFASINDSNLGRSTSSDSSMDIAIQWVTDCEKHHNKCRTARSGFVPTRLVEIDIGKYPNLRLVLGEDLAVDAKYVTLSHCWGKSMPTRLLKDNLASMLDSIPTHSLSKTFQEAIQVASKLGIRYIWIDSLCIIQDDLMDWQINSAVMDQVYAHSSCNISATASEEGSQGLYRDRNSLPMHHLKFDTNINGEQVQYYLWDENTWEKSVDNAPLNQRAWVCQERFLSPCNLHFASDQLFWECREFSACELFPKGFPAGLGDPPRLSKKWISQSIVLSNIDIAASDDEIQTAYNNWNLIITMYTSLRLTFERDKLVGLSGLASTWSRVLKDEYIAGHWRKTLPLGLVWYSNDPRTEHENRKYTAPSWSWAAIDGTIVSTFQPPLSNSIGPRCLVQICDINVELANNDTPFGQVKAGYLIVKGRLARAGYRALAPDRHNLGGIELHMPTESAPDADADIYVNWDIPNGGFRDIGKLLMFDGDGTALRLLPIIYDESQQSMKGLVLLQTDARLSEFKRYALFTANGDFSVNRVKEACKHFDSYSIESGLERYHDEEGQLQYKITLI